MKHRTMLALTLLAATAAAQGSGPRYAPIPGFNVGFSPNAVVTAVQHMGQPALLVLIRGDDAIATFHDPAFMPAGTTEVESDVLAFAVWEPNACAVGAEIYFDTYGPAATIPVATVSSVGLNVLTPAWFYTIRFMKSFYSTWLASYCHVMGCTSPCGPADRDPDLEAYLLTVRAR